MSQKQCILYDRPCNDCGECDFCELDPSKRCDNCMKCVNGDAEYRAVVIDSVEGSPEAAQQKRGSKLQ